MHACRYQLNLAHKSKWNDLPKDNLQFDQRLALAQRERERVRLLRFWQTAADVENPQGRLTGAERHRLERKIKDVEMEVR